jgi:nucleoside-diphosphate-sugar epimerase
VGYWEGKKVVVTGGCGFVAHHLVPLLLEAGAEVAVVTRTTECPELGVKTLYWDMGNTDSCRWAFHDADAVFNLAAVVGGQKDTMAFQARHFLANVTTQCAPAIAAFEAGVETFVQVSSVSAYAPKYSTMAIEAQADLGQPAYGYGYAKRMGEQTIRWLCEKHPWRGIIVRMTNMCGEHDHYGPNAHVVPYLIWRFVESNGEPVVLYGNGKGTRDLMHAEDGARGMMAAAERGTGGRLYNIGTGQEVTIRALAEKIRDLTGSQSRIEFSDPTAVVDERRCTVSSRALCELGWKPQICLGDGLRRAVNWYMEHEKGKYHG